MPKLFLMDPTRTTTASYLSPESTMPSWDFGHDYGASPPNILAMMGGHHRSAAPLNNGANFLFCTSSPSCVVLRACCASKTFETILKKRDYVVINVRHSPPHPLYTCLSCPAAAMSGSARVIQPAAMKHGHV